MNMTSRSLMALGNFEGWSREAIAPGSTWRRRAVAISRARPGFRCTQAGLRAKLHRVAAPTGAGFCWAAFLALWRSSS